MRQVIWHDFVEFSLSDVTELKVFDFDALPCISYLIYLRLHLVQISFQSLLTLLVSEFNFLIIFLISLNGQSGQVGQGGQGEQVTNTHTHV